MFANNLNMLNRFAIYILIDLKLIPVCITCKFLFHICYFIIKLCV
jgi:hypothetical protein